jgi:predicted 2-oxoglutarate/Fe(II)-dependent dioxygenase YbiX
MFYQKVLFNKEECEKIINLTKTITKIEGKNKYAGDNRTEVSFDEYKIVDDETNGWFMNKIKQFVEETLKIKLIRLNNDAHILCYGINDGFGKHIDYNPMGDESRVYTFGLLLNTEYEGGDFIMYDKEKTIFNKVVGNSYLFETTIPHEVEKITNGVRYTLIIHIKKSEIKKINLF